MRLDLGGIIAAEVAQKFACQRISGKSSCLTFLISKIDIAPYASPSALRNNWSSVLSTIADRNITFDNSIARNA